MKYFTADQVLSPYIFVFYASYIVALLLTPMLRSVAIYFGVVDQPDGLRKMHTKPVAYLGGVAVFLGWLSGLAMSQFLTLHSVEDGMAKNLVVDFNILVSACIILALGLFDDLLRVNPWVKIAGQVIAALSLVLGGGIGRRSAFVLLSPIITRASNHLGFTPIAPDQLAQHWIIQVASVILVVLLVVACCNATNLMDGLDGLCGGVTAVVAVGFVFLSVNLAMHSGAVHYNDDALRVVLGLALLGAVLGFVPFNFNPASIFMGDTGSMFLGFVCALMMILFASQPQHFKWFLASLVMFSLPTLDTALAFVRRWVNGRPIFSADRCHFHHQLVARGFSVKQTVLISYGLSVIFCLLAWAIVFTRTRYALAVYLVVFGSIIVAAYKMGMVHERVGAKKLSAKAPGPLLPQSQEILDQAEQLPASVFSDRPGTSGAWPKTPASVK